MRQRLSNPVRGGLSVVESRTHTSFLFFGGAAAVLVRNSIQPPRRAAQKQKGEVNGVSRSTDRPPLTGFRELGQTPNRATFAVPFRISAFDLPSDFGLRTSDFSSR
jgi:hypothetical protein